MSADSPARPLAVHSVDEFVMSVPDLQQARHFYESFGLDVRELRDGTGGLALHTFGHEHRWARVHQGRHKRLLWLSLGMHAEDLPAFERRLAQLGVPRIPSPDATRPDGLWIEGPDRLPIALRVAEKSSPSSPAPRRATAPSGANGRAPARSAVAPVRPLYLSHVLLFSADVARARDFYEGVLGLRLSDHSGSLIAFLHTPHGSDHHLLALAKSDGGGLHHSSWCVDSLDDVGLGMEQMGAAGYPDGWGVGRHVLGSNYFRYVRDPWGSFAEYSYDIDFIAAGQRWPSADHPAHDSLYVWGPAVPPDFVTNHESAQRRAART